MVPKVELRGIGLRYHSLDGETEAIKDLNLRVMPEEFISIVGPSGCGKSTLLSLIAGLMKPSQGEVFMDGEPITGNSRKVGYMLQHDYLLEWRTILRNALLGLEIRHEKTPEAVERVRDLLNQYGLGDFANHHPSQLSGGMRQRVALIRTLAINPEILLLDEPFSALDYQTRLTIQEEVGSILRQAKKTVILVTHDISEAIAMSDRVVVLSRRPGRVKAEFNVEFSHCKGSAMKARESGEFAKYFNQIWQELDVHV